MQERQIKGAVIILMFAFCRLNVQLLYIDRIRYLDIYSSHSVTSVSNNCVFFCAPQLRSAEEASQKKRLAEATDSTTKEMFQQMDKEIKEQEMLIKGYQQVCFLNTYLFAATVHFCP